MSISTWKLGVILSCGVTAVGIIIILNKVKKSFIDEENKKRRVAIDNSQWIKIGKITKLYYYPLKSGRGKELKECKFTEYGIALNSSESITLRDRMFMVYDEENGEFITGRNYPTLLLVSISGVDKSKVKLQATGMTDFIFELPKDTKNDTVDCTMWWGEPLKCTDCGNEPAKWISKFLTGRDFGLRIGLACENSRNISKGPWEKFIKVYKTLTNNDIGLFADLASYMIMTESSLEELNKKLKNKVSALQFRPNIVVSGTEAFMEDNWEWIKIGENVILRNFKPCSRCTMTRVNPETGTIDDKLEPLKTLRTFRQQNDPDRISVDGKAPILGIYCGLYEVGQVQIGDDVFYTPGTP